MIGSRRVLPPAVASAIIMPRPVTASAESGIPSGYACGEVRMPFESKPASGGSGRCRIAPYWRMPTTAKCAASPPARAAMRRRVRVQGSRADTELAGNRADGRAALSHARSACTSRSAGLGVVRCACTARTPVLRSATRSRRRMAATDSTGTAVALPIVVGSNRVTGRRANVRHAETDFRATWINRPSKHSGDL